MTIERSGSGPAPPDLRIREARDSAAYDCARVLFGEYADSLGVDLEFQGFRAELANLSEMYSAPHGALLLAHSAGALVGCGALRLSGQDVCEMKRLFVRPRWQGLNAGKLLAQALIVRARELGFQRLRLDTLPSMTAAIGLYGKLGFVEIDAYYETPIEGTKFLELKL